MMKKSSLIFPVFYTLLLEIGTRGVLELESKMDLIMLQSREMALLIFLSGILLFAVN